MATKHPDIFGALAAPFDASEVKVRSQNQRQMKYITARTAMNRLDDVLGPENWWDTFAPNEKSVQCAISIRLPDGSVLTKCDAGGYAGMADSGDDDKSGYSDAFKRAAVKFGVARYLYRDGVPTFAHEHAGPAAPATGPDPSDPPPGKGDAFDEFERPAAAPDRQPAQAPAQAASRPAQPRGEPARGREPARGNGHGDGGGNGGGNGGGRNYGPPKSGKALFAWTKDQEQRYEVGLLKYINGWAKLQDFPGRMVDWDEEQVSLAYQEATRKLAAVGQGGDHDEYEEALAN